LGEPVQQRKQVRRGFRNFASKDRAKPRADLIADRAAMGGVER
jgi:hypothetical protein